MTQARWLHESLAALVERRELTAEQMRGLMEEVIAGAGGEGLVAAVLVALRMKGETAVEIAAAAGVLREHMVRLETGRDDVLDTCGTGGDGSGTFNISTAAALVAAGAGVAVVKHGNRAVSSRSGSADVLAALGVAVERDAAFARRCLAFAGLAFCFAPHFHPALSQVAPVRRRLGVRTIFNCLGPLANPAGAAYQLLGVGRRELLDPLAGAMARLGTRHALLVCGADGLDEVSLAGPTLVRDVRGDVVTAGEWLARDFGLAPCSMADLHAAGPLESAALVRAVLDGQDGPALRVVLANAAAALLAAERVQNPAEGVALATEAVHSGRARQVLERLVACSCEDGGAVESPALGL
ncbi:MAG TPA: anthranilate phosphoribosyltransferase [Gemmataceae bacterium]|jgi:anthranilate phosphoribosyltransferase|nr:anthranilate phosphoribosyltransferase [Gemmataceae bacterium]